MGAGLFATFWCFSSHLCLNSAHGHAITAGNGTEARGALENDMANVGGHSHVSHCKIILCETRIVHREILNHNQALSILQLGTQFCHLFNHSWTEWKVLLCNDLRHTRMNPRYCSTGFGSLWPHHSEFFKSSPVHTPGPS